MQNLSYENEFYLHENTVADSDLQIRGGNGHPDPEIWRGGGGLKKKFRPPPQKKKISALRTSVWSKNKGGGPPGPLPWIRTGIKDHFQINEFPSRLALEQRPGAIRKWPIN